MYYYGDEKKKKSGKAVLVIILAILIIAAAAAIFLNFDKIKYFVLNGELPDPAATQTAGKVAEVTLPPEATATPEPLPAIVPEGTTVGTRFNPPAGYTRVAVDAGSYAEYLRNYTLRPYGTTAKLADGTDNTEAPTLGVFDQTIRANGLQQCADAIIRLRAEYLYAKGDYDKIVFDCYTTPVFTADFSYWITGQRIRANGNKLEWYASDAATPGDTSYGTLLYFLDMVFLYANTYSLKNQMMQVDPANIEIGDCLIITADQTGNQDGHAIFIVDMAVNDKGEKIFMLAEGNTPATETYIMVNRDTDSVWFSLNEDGSFTKSNAEGVKVTYPVDALRRFKK